MIEESYTRESKKEGNIPSFSHVAARVQGEDLALRHEIVHDTEETLFHFPCILCPKDHHFLPCKIKINASGGCHVVSVTIARKLPSIVYSEIRCAKVL